MVTHARHSMTARRLTLIQEVLAAAQLPGYIRITAARGENRVVLTSMLKCRMSGVRRFGLWRHARMEAVYKYPLIKVAKDVVCKDKSKWQI